MVKEINSGLICATRSKKASTSLFSIVYPGVVAPIGIFWRCFGLPVRRLFPTTAWLLPSSSCLLVVLPAGVVVAGFAVVVVDPEACSGCFVLLGGQEVVVRSGFAPVVVADFVVATAVGPLVP